MIKSLRIAQYGVCIFLIVLTLGIWRETYANPDRINIGPFFSRNVSTSDPDSLSLTNKYQDNLSSLENYFKKEGTDITPLLNDSRFEIYEKIGDRFRNAAERKSPNLESYKKILDFNQKQKNIIDFIDKHSDELEKAEHTYGISKYVISAIIGIESNFGKNFGSYNPFNSYVSMYVVGYRQDFARDQIKELLEFTRRNNIDVFELKSSYAGAMSYAQFIPYSLNKWFVGDDIFDINNNILSIANYLSYFKKRTGSIEKAVLQYNHSDLYARTVLDLAQTTEEHFLKSASR